MRFKSTAITPKGRNKYGEYISSNNIAKKVIKASYYGDTTNNDITGGGDGGGTTAETDDGNFVLDISTSSYDFDGSILPLSSITKQISVVGYKGRTKADTYVGDISVSTETQNHAISGIPEVGMTVVLDDNGTPNTKIYITISSDLTETSGILYLPIAINLKSIPGDPLEDDITAWNSNSGDCVTEIFEFEWRVLDFGGTSSAAYRLDLTNENASINCDSNGNILSGATRPTCTAKLWYGIEPVTGATYGISLPSAQNVSGVSIDTSTGVLTFGNNFGFDGTPLEIMVTATIDGTTFRNVMTISKAYPGSDGSPASSYWLVLSNDAVHVNVNTNPYTVAPNVVSASSMMQIGQETPTAATGCNIYYGFDTASPATSYPSSGVTVDTSKSYLSFVLKKGSAIVDGVETVPILKDGTNGQDGQSPYRLDLSNQNASINCDSDGNILSGATRPTCTAKLWYGASPVTGASYSISNYSLSTSGVSINSSTGVISFNNGNATTPFNFTGGTALEITVQAKINNVLYGTAIMTVSKSIAGKNGTDGSNGRGITSVTEYYGLSSSATSEPSSWSTTVQTPTSGSPYLWNYEAIHYSDGTSSSTSPAIIGMYSKDGENGRGISSITEYYQISNSSASTPSSWSTSMVVPTESKPYLWNYEKVVYTDSTSSSTTPVIIGVRGNNGDNGRSITGVTEYYACNNSTTSAPTSWSTTVQNPTSGSPYLWNYEKISYSSGSDTTTSPVIIAMYTKDGENGKGISSITEYYQISSSSSVTPSSWSTSVVVPTDASPYLWNYEKIVFTDSSSSSTTPVIIGIKGKDGNDGRGITGVTEYYAINNDKDNAPSTGWTTSAQTPTSGNPYLWNYEEISYTVGNSTITTPAIIGTFSKDGKGISSITEYYAVNNSTASTPTSWSTSLVVPDDSNPYLWNYELITYSDGTTGSTTPVIIGVKGTKGTDGKGITGVTEYYACNNSKTSAPSSWSTTVQTPTSGNPYLWNYEVISYTVGPSTSTDPAIIGMYSQDGKGISSVTEYYAINNSTASTPTSWSTSLVVPTSGNPYLWNYETITYSDGSTSSTTPVIIGIRGSNGTDGDDAVSYWLILSADEVKVDTGLTYSPALISATPWKQVGEQAPVSGDSVGATIKYGYDTVSPQNDYNSPIYASGGTNYITFQMLVNGVQRDIETIPILRDGQNGQDGGQGRQGAAVRGPVNWYSAMENSGRRWCNGQLTDNNHPEDAQWLDVIIKDGVYYYCSTSYTEQGQAWSSVTANWTSADSEYNFVATNLLLANNAYIDFLTGNEIYLRDSAGTITAGAAGGNGVSFWAGANEANSNAPFRVQYDGTIYATRGIFSGYVQMPYEFISDLRTDIQLSATTVGTLYLSQTHFLGSFTSAPSSPSTGDSYYNTSYSPGVFYYCKVAGSWTQMSRCKNGLSDIERGYIADHRAYLIADYTAGLYGMGDGGMLVLPEPSAELNGFTYKIIIESNVATKSQGMNPGISVMTANETSSFIVYAYSTMINPAKRLSFYGGCVELTCMKKHDDNMQVYYMWACTQCTGGVDVYSGTTSIGLVMSYATIDCSSLGGFENTISHISIDDNPNKQADTIYFNND